MTYEEILKNVNAGIRVDVLEWTIMKDMTGKIVIFKTSGMVSKDFSETVYSAHSPEDFEIGSWTGYCSDIGSPCF